MSRSFFCKAKSCFSWSVVLALVLQPYAALANTQAMAEQPVAPAIKQATIADIELQSDRSLVGQVVSATGAGVSDVAIELTNGQHAWKVKTDKSGWFQVANLRGGTYQFRTAEHQQMLRAWAAGTAPPKASLGLLVTPSTDVVRGQRVLSPNTNQFFRVAKQRLANPLVVAGVVVTAVAIPVAIDAADDDDPPATP